ncbi:MULTISPECIES: hypothetical protein [Aliivibrio]|uniref:Uncharacterized protein n=1 Tax=Aliivibrio finisterrensis TaxID=511998 RepID=A0A4Q5KYD6_9GAMM|nr:MULTISPECIES: hypothetical protein [Aliivibrio]MDD9180267.1 hypothetical protein [Aliivibrio sp. A6]RYU54872.1 hypothetical protein ERW57_01100 [Aliivibrio finisterrensis]RYU56548.1 hypothetical protein ERW56_00780 [Aliivibrio finisterrensis]RYU61669.1 hypothetical protein ERW50_00780 [Aliivibrio finisterrensis]RYU66498.1 hypothetical protein ERW53_02215 [Aliivibrio finisterrensis]
MIDLLSKYSALVVVSVGIFFLTGILYLTIKLRRNKHEIIRNISNSAPVAFKEKSLFSMESNMSWIVGSALSYIWFIYPILRIFYRISSLEISKWNCKIKASYGRYSLVFLVTIYLGNIAWLAFCIFVFCRILNANA